MCCIQFLATLLLLTSHHASSRLQLVRINAAASPESISNAFESVQRVTSVPEEDTKSYVQTFLCNFKVLSAFLPHMFMILYIIPVSSNSFWKDSMHHFPRVFPCLYQWRPTLLHHRSEQELLTLLSHHYLLPLSIHPLFHPALLDQRLHHHQPESTLTTL